MRPEQWLNLFGTVSATFLLILSLLFMPITPMVPLPAFIDLPAATTASKSPDDFTLSHCWDCGPDFPAFLVVTIVFFAPVGAFVLRRHIASATGTARLAGRVLQAAALVSLLPAILLILAVLLLLVS
ncbi:MAG TPA: hypothetical protein VEO54_08905 [Thermoanaerobaculia bacterium]|nr:hypothetical protein [Thermoanaerobaculia bacterium]